jgi:predicted ribosome quality control (RQC) complex YloA/Tae2 family protein
MLTFTTPNGANVFVGQDAKENDYLTFSFAHKTDIWFHVDALPGSHVLLRQTCLNASTLTHEDIEFAAQKAALYSKAKGKNKCIIVYCQVIDVAKDKWAKDGQVRLLGDAKRLIVKC